MCAFVLISHKAVLDAIELIIFCADIPHSNALIKAESATSDAWIRKIVSFPIIGKMLKRMFCASLAIQMLCVDSPCTAIIVLTPYLKSQKTRFLLF